MSLNKQSDRRWLGLAIADADGARVVEDPGGEQARRFGAVTSGQTYLFSPDGELLFLGFVDEGAAARSTSEVFGCALADDAPRLRVTSVIVTALGAAEEQWAP